MSDRKLDYRAFVEGLAGAQVRYVLTGSVAAALYGVPVSPNDFDIAPELAADNLERLAGLLAAWEARPQYNPNWEGRLTPEQIAAWRPDPPTAKQLDHLMETKHGLFDVVPELTGNYAILVERALPVQTFGVEVQVAHVADLMATMKPKAEKHIRRLAHMQAALRRVEAGETPVGFEALRP